MNYSVVLSMLFFAAFGVYFFMAVFTLHLDSRSSENRIFAFISVLLAVWSLGFSIANSAADYETALLWRRVSAFGWSTIYSFFLHFMLVLTGREKILQKKWIYPLLYFPAAINLFVFSLYTPVAEKQYRIFRTATGWLNESGSTSFDLFFNTYYICYLFCTLLLLTYWRLSCSQTDKKTASLLIKSILFAGILGTMTDTVFSTYMPGAVPQLAPLIIMVPIGAIYYSMRKYGLLKTKQETSSFDYGEILNEYTREKVFKYLGLVLAISSFVSMFALYFLYHLPLKEVAPFSGSLFIMGGLIQVLNQSGLSPRQKDGCLILIIVLSIPLIMIRFIGNASITAWAAPAFFLMVGVLFKQSWFIRLLEAAIILTLIFIWWASPVVQVTVDHADHFIRIFLYLLFASVAIRVNRLFIQRLEEHEMQIKLHKMMASVSALFVNLSETELCDIIDESLRIFGEELDVDRVYYFSISDDQKKISYDNEWCREDIESFSERYKEFSVLEFPWWMERVFRNETIYFPDLELMPSDAWYEKHVLRSHQVQSFISTPIVKNNRTWGILVFDYCKENKKWEDRHLNILRVTAHILADGIEEKFTESKIKHMAFYDALTGLTNKALFFDRLRNEIDLAARAKDLIGVVFIDLDSFKGVNDTVGHSGGDELLVTVGQRLSGCVRKTDTVARFGGDEFVIMLTQLQKVHDILRVVEEIMKVFEKPFFICGEEFHLTASAGVAVYPIDGEDSETLLKHSDIALYTSKDLGKNRFTLCTPLLKEDTAEKMRLTNDLFRALEHNELELYYQPQLCIATGKINGLEALLRWKHPELGTISPSKFIPLAEQNGTINPIGEWVLKTAVRQNKKWQTMGFPHLRIAVNVSVVQYNDPNFISIVRKVLKETDMDPSSLELEITETIAVKSSSDIMTVLKQLKNLGIRLAIDDFGTEYSSLNRLKSLPVDRIKMDMHFVQSISKSQKDDTIARIILQLAESLGLKVIAEGVETQTQLNFLSKQVCDEVQGYYYYKPMPAAEVGKILQECCAKKQLT